MREKNLKIVLGSGWLFLALFLTSGYYFNKLSNNSTAFKFIPITWENHLQIFNGAIQCNLVEADLLERKKLLKEAIFSKVQTKEESLNSFIYYFNDDPNLLESVLEHVQIEKACCPFFKFDISILPFNKGFALQISGSEDALKMLEEFEYNKF